MFGALVVLGCALTFASVAQCDDNNEYNWMLPYERSSLDDCEERFYKKIDPIKVAPAAGSPAYLREFAHIAAIGWTNEDQSVRWLCGGSLIWENFILTAAHCAADDNNVPPDVARMGDINIYSDEDDEFAQQLKIVDIIRHPMHRFSSTYYDIALMKLERNVTVHDTVAPTCLWLDDEIRFPELLAAGWGRTGFGEDTTKTLLKVQLAPIDNEKCSTYYNKGDRVLRDGLMEHQLCAGDEKMDTCPGDSGGPLHVKLFDGWKLTPFLVGVTSFGKACGVSAPGVYVKVSKFSDWIIETLQHHGEMATRFMFEPLVCARRYNNLREYKENLVYKVNLQEYIEWSNIYVSSSTSNFTVKLSRQYTNDSVSSNCSGTLIEPNVVLTTAECVLDERQVFFLLWHLNVYCIIYYQLQSKTNACCTGEWKNDRGVGNHRPSVVQFFYFSVL
uniref:serine protease snake-like isoform X3 n=1 Tax=Anopheles coluzzii TaxID=1518534 RepID=UPI0020FFA56B|nr:serine protease snake-like isoform X3 [Anopheles coluzzii]